MILAHQVSPRDLSLCYKPVISIRKLPQGSIIVLQVRYTHQETAPGVYHCATSQLYPSGICPRGLSLCYKSVIPIKHLPQGSIIVLQVMYTHQTSAPGVYHCATSRLYPSAICPRGLTLCYKSVIPISHLPQESIIVLQVIYTHQASVPGVYHCATSRLYPSAICPRGLTLCYKSFIPISHLPQESIIVLQVIYTHHTSAPGVYHCATSRLYPSAICPRGLTLCYKSFIPISHLPQESIIVLQVIYTHQASAPGVYHCATSRLYPSAICPRGLTLCYKSFIPISHLPQESIIVLQVIYTHQTSAPGVYHCATSRLYPSAICPRGLTLCYKSFIPISHLPQESIIVLQVIYTHQASAPGVYHCVTSHLYPSGIFPRGLSLCYKSVIPISHLPQGSIIVLQVSYTHQPSAPGVYHCVTSQLYPSGICLQGIITTYSPPFSSADDQYNH